MLSVAALFFTCSFLRCTFAAAAFEKVTCAASSMLQRRYIDSIKTTTDETSTEAPMLSPTAAPSEVCDWRCYLDRYADLQSAFGKNNTAAAQQHYETTGHSQGRDCTCSTPSPTPSPRPSPTPSPTQAPTPEPTVTCFTYTTKCPDGKINALGSKLCGLTSEGLSCDEATCCGEWRTVISARRRTPIRHYVRRTCERGCGDYEEGPCETYDCSRWETYVPQDVGKNVFDIEIRNRWTQDFFPTDFPAKANISEFIAVTCHNSFSLQRQGVGLNTYVDTGNASQLEQQLRNAGNLVHEAKVIQPFVKFSMATVDSPRQTNLYDNEGRPANNTDNGNTPALLADTLQILMRFQPSPDWYSFASINLKGLKVTSSTRVLEKDYWPTPGYSFDAYAEAYDAGIKDGATYIAPPTVTRNSEGIRKLSAIPGSPLHGTDGRVLQVTVTQKTEEPGSLKGPFDVSSSWWFSKSYNP